MDSPSTPDVALQPQPSKDNLTEAVQILSLIRDEGLTVGAAGARLGLSRGTAFRRLRLVEEDENGVVKLLTAKAIDFAEDWIKASQKAAEKGDHRPAKDALLHAKLIEPVEDSSQGRTNIAIVIGTPEKPISLPAPQVVETQIVSGSHE